VGGNCLGAAGSVSLSAKLPQGFVRGTLAGDERALPGGLWVPPGARAAGGTQRVADSRVAEAGLALAAGDKANAVPTDWFEGFVSTLG
jgi:hypothetical protein